MPTTFRLDLPAEPSPLVRKAADLLTARLQERSGARRVDSPDAEVLLQLAVEPAPGPEGFRLDDLPGGVRLVGHDDRGLLYAVGKFLRGCRFSPEGFTPSPWRGASVPAKPVRGIYFATHFHNFYHDGPLPEITRYLEDLALWGVNTLMVWFDMHHFTGMDQPEAQAMLARLKAILAAGREVGMSAGIAALGNEAWADSPEELRAQWERGERRLGGHYHLELCPHQPGALELTLQWHEQRLQAFAEVQPEYLWIWPYDQGGCCCEQCDPWGPNGFLLVAEPLARLARRYLPSAKIVLSTWDFDLFTTGEWEGLARAFATPPDWVDLLLADGREGDFPAWPREHGAPGGFSMAGFPEISMPGFCPWGGFGANPLPRMCEHLWGLSRDLLVGGWPYSEGIFEDLNKVLFAQFYWDPARPAEEIVKEYAAYEFAPEVAEAVWQAALLLEQTLPRRREGDLEHRRYVLEHPEGAEAAFRLLEQVEGELPAWARESWRWRVLWLRALADRELVTHDFAVTDACEAALEELTRIYHAEQAAGAVAPPTYRALRAARPE